MVSFRFDVRTALLVVVTFILTNGHILAQSRYMAPHVSQFVRFTENRGQVVDTRGNQRSDILYVARSGNVQIFLRSTGISYLFTRIENAPSATELTRPGLTPLQRYALDSATRVTRHRMDMEVIGANPYPHVTTEQQTSDLSNYYLPHCPNGITGVRSFGEVIYHDIYPNIDLVLHGSNYGMKYDFVVRPGGRVGDIRLRYDGADSLHPAREGSIQVMNSLGNIEEGTPLTYQTHGTGSGTSVQSTVASSYRLRGDTISFNVGTYDASMPLVIDPTLAWSTYYGGNSVDYISYGTWQAGHVMSVDRRDRLVLTGMSASTNFPITPGTSQTSLAASYDAVIIKMTGSGNRIWATYYGGTYADYSDGLAVDSANTIYVAGRTQSTDLPVTSVYQTSHAGGSWDSFLAKFDSLGNRIWATFYGGSNLEVSGNVAVDSSGNVILCGSTLSTGLASVGAAQTTPAGGYDLYIAKFTSAGSRLWATYYGGSGSENYPAGVAADKNGNIIIAGTTASSNLPLSSTAYQGMNGGAYDAFIAKFSPLGTRLWSTYLGGSANEIAANVIADRDSNIAVTTYSASSNFPVSTSAFQSNSGNNGDATLTRFSPAGVLRWSTYLGGNSTDWPNGLATDNSRNLVLSGYTQSTNFPVTSDAYQLYLNGFVDGLVMKFDSSGQLRWGTYIGGNDYDLGNGVATDRNSIYICGTTYSTNFPVTSGAFQTSRDASYDLFISKFCDILPTVSISGTTQICPGESVVLTASADFESYLWSTGAVTRSITVSQPGQYFVTASIGACSGSSDTVHVTLYPTVKPKISPNNSVFCDGDSVYISIPGTYASQRWSTGATTSRIVVRQTGSYYADAVDINGCVVRSDTANVTVTPLPNPVVVPRGVITLCQGDTVELDAGSGYRDYLWSTFETTRKIRVSKAGTYSVKVTSQQFCSATSQPITVRLNTRPDSTVTPLRPLDFCEGDSTIVVARSGYRYQWSTGATTQLVTIRKSGQYSLTVTDSVGCSSTAQFRVHVTPAMWQSIYVEGDRRVICEGDSVVLDAGANQKGYRWSTGETTQRIVVRAAGNYSVRFESPIGCPGYSDTVRLTVYPRPLANINGPVGVCSNSIATYAVEQNPELRYAWKVSGADGAILTGAGTSQATVRWGSSGTGRVHLTVTNPGTGCSADNEIAVDVGSGIKPVILANRPARICPSDSITLDAGPGYAIYRWSTGEMTRHITVTEAQPYTVIVTNNDGCTGASDPFIVVRNPDLAPAITPLGPTDFCRGDSVLLDAGDFAGYVWSNGAQTRRIAVRDPGNYTVTVTDTFGCSGTSQPISVTQYTPPSPVIDGPNSVCARATAQYTADDISGDSYHWSVSSGGTITDGQGTSSITIKWSGVGPESIDLVQTSNGVLCEGVAERYNVTVSNTIVPNVAVKGSATFCEGDSVRLSAPGGYDSYKWSTGDTTQQITVNAAGIYSVRVVSSEGCEGTSTPVIVTVVERPIPTIAINGPLSFCEGDSVVLSAPAGYLDYRWSNGETTPTITVKETGTYMVAVTNTNGCDGASFAVAVDVHPLPALPMIARNGDTLNTASAPGEYQWTLDGTPIPGGTRPELVATEPGTYRVRLTNDNGCSVESAPYQVIASKPIYILSLDTVSAVAGERLTLTMSVDTALTVADAITSYRFQLHIDKLALFPLHVTTPSAVTGGVPSMIVRDGSITIEANLTTPLTGRELFKLEMLGLITGQPVNNVTIEGALLNGITVDSTGDGLVLLSGCDIGRELKLEKAIAIKAVRPNPVGDDAIIVYRAPEGSTPQLVVSDMAGRDVLSLDLPPGTGEEQQHRLNATSLASGVYRFELRDRNERSIVPVIIVR